MALRSVFAVWLSLVVFVNVASSDDTSPPPPVELNKLEQAFVEQLSGVMMEGTFSLDLRPGAAPSSERYEIQSVQKVKDHDWVVTARIVYGNLNVPLPVPVQVYWADQTPVLQVTNLTLPLLGEGFTARVLFQDQRYAGTWQHGKVGGQMWGKLVRTEKAKDSSPPPALETPRSAP